MVDITATLSCTSWKVCIHFLLHHFILIGRNGSEMQRENWPSEFVGKGILLIIPRVILHTNDQNPFQDQEIFCWCMCFCHALEISYVSFHSWFSKLLLTRYSGYDIERLMSNLISWKVLHLSENFPHGRLVCANNRWIDIRIKVRKKARSAKIHILTGSLNTP